MRSKENTSKNHLCLFSLCQPVTRTHAKYSALRKYSDLVLQLFLAAFSCFFMTCMVHLVPQNNSDFFSVNNEKVTWIMWFAPDECGPFLSSLFNAGYSGAHIHIWGAFKKPQSVINCKNLLRIAWNMQSFETIFKADTVNSAYRNDNPLLLYTHLYPTVFHMGNTCPVYCDCH